MDDRHRRGNRSARDDEEDWFAQRTPSPGASSQEEVNSESVSPSGTRRQPGRGRGRGRGYNPFDQRSHSPPEEQLQNRSPSPSSFSQFSGRIGRQISPEQPLSGRPPSGVLSRRDAEFSQESPMLSPQSSAAPSRMGSKGTSTPLGSARPRKNWRSDDAEIASVGSSTSRRSVILQKRTIDLDYDFDPVPISPKAVEPVPQVVEPPPRKEPEPSPPAPPVRIEIPEVREDTPPPIVEEPEQVWEVLPEDEDWPFPTREDVAYQDVHTKCGDKPLELAALARLRAWEKGPGAVHSLEEAMDVVRWLEQQLEPPKGDALHLWEALRKTDRQVRAGVIASAFCVAALLLVVIGLLTAAALAIQRVASIESSGIMTADDLAAGTAMVVNAKSLVDYPSLPLEELRRAQDVVFKNDGAFHFYRLSSATSAQGGAAVKLLGEDSTIIHVEDGRVAVTPPFAREGLLDAADLSFLGGGDSSLASTGAFRVVVPYSN